MSDSLLPMMTRALELVRSGRLTQATAAIQAALAGARDDTVAAPRENMSARDSDVIDVEAREVRRDGPRPPLPVIALPAATSFAAAPDPKLKDVATDESATVDAPGAATPSRFLDGSHTEAAGTRRYRLFVPSGDARQQRPMVVMLHGCTQDAADFALGTRMNEAGEREGCYVLYPEQAQGKNPSRCWNWFKHNHQQRGRGEPAILAGMVRAVLAQHRIDPRRVYVAGLSAGGAMAAILGETYPDLFAAVGVHSGLPTGAARDLASAMAAMQGQGTAPSADGAHRPPIIVFHGDQDRTVHPSNGQRIVAAHPAAATRSVEQVGDAGGRGATRTVQHRADGVAVAEHWQVHGAGHAWSGGSRAGTFTDPAGPDASAQMLRFFAEHRLPAC